MLVTLYYWLHQHQAGAQMPLKQPVNFVACTAESRSFDSIATLSSNSDILQIGKENMQTVSSYRTMASQTGRRPAHSCSIDSSRLGAPVHLGSSRSILWNQSNLRAAAVSRKRLGRCQTASIRAEKVLEACFQRR